MAIDIDNLYIHQEDDGSYSVTSGDDLYYNSDTETDCRCFLDALAKDLEEDEDDL